MKFYFWIAFYSDGRIRAFNTKREPKPVNRLGKGKLLCITKYKVKVQV